jgi:AbrB family looped-hinge helix DNA binding protein
MKPITVSPRFQVLLPKKVREQIKIKVGQKMHVFVFDNIITLIPVRPIREARGSLKNINAVIVRDDIDRV